ncbi:MAG: hypothetical protein QOC78_2003 [Solirubrobacteraceae bacterium]|jgi:hypothetical protein|nr:hypothetical protein [Solirubrobacteraceae bacterium]MEA2393549.1 hypothetical protein [Solirubrobacteraceae bacterium]
MTENALSDLVFRPPSDEPPHGPPDDDRAAAVRAELAKLRERPRDEPRVVPVGRPAQP